jgi:hypothetical protein
VNAEVALIPNSFVCAQDSLAPKSKRAIKKYLIFFIPDSESSPAKKAPKTINNPRLLTVFPFEEIMLQS